MCSWRRRMTSSAKLLAFMVPLIIMVVLFGLVSLIGENNNSVLTNRNLISGNTTNLIISSNVLEDSMLLSPQKARGNISTAGGDPVVVGGGAATGVSHEVAAAPSPSPLADYNKAVGQKEIILNITANDSFQIYPPLNETHALPLSARIQRRSSIHLERLEAKMQKARTAIRGASYSNQSYDPDYVPTGPMYWNANSFHRSYLEMEKQFKVYVYGEGEPPIFHNGPCKSIYAMEGNFIYYMENSKFRTKDPDKANMFFLPISMTTIVHFIFDKRSKDHWHPLKKTVRDYVNLVAGKYPYWNRSHGGDHFILACHDWGPELSLSVPELYQNSIRCLCNANTSEGFNPSKDVSFPEIHLPGGTINELIGGPSPSKRPILAFFAGGLHGPIRPILLEHWENNKDPDIQIHKYLPKGVSYYGMMKKSKYCICPSGYEVASPRLVEALYTGCVPVIIKDHYVAPFSDVLNWKAFSVDIPVKDIPNLKNILAGISTRQYIRMQRRGKQVRRHFEVSFPPKRYDVFHMILHSVWLRRLNIRLNGGEDS